MKPKTPKKTIGETVREIRGTRTQAEFTELLGISQAFLSEIEQKGTGQKDHTQAGRNKRAAGRNFFQVGEADGSNRANRPQIVGTGNGPGSCQGDIGEKGGTQ